MARTAGTARQRILEVAGPLFFRDGYRAVGVDTIVEQSGVAKMTLYRYFPSKDDLIIAYLEKTNADFWVWFEEAIEPFRDDPRRQLEVLYAALTDLTSGPACYGCSFQSAAAEFPERDQPVHQTALNHKLAVRKRLTDLAQAAQARQPEALADQLLLLMDGAFVAARMYGTDTPAYQVSKAANALIAAQC